MSLRYLAGDTEEMIEEDTESDKAVMVEVDKDEVIEVEVVDLDEEEFEDIEPLLEIEPDMVDACANVCANVIIKNINNLEDLANERVRFFFEEISGAVANALEMCDFSEFSYQLWYENEMIGSTG